MSIIQPRSEWTATKEGFSYALRPDTVTGFAIHYPGIGNVTTAGRSDDWAKQQLRNYRAYHVNTRGWADIGYNIAISQNGTAWWAAGKKKAAHCASKSNPTANARHVGILLIIGNSERPTAAMVTTLNRVIAEVQAEFPGARTILGHREVPGASTACPGTVILGMIHDGTIRASSSGGIGGGMSPVVVPPPVKNARAGRTYKPGEVERIQRILADLGYYKGAIDDDYGNWTHDAVEAYQRAQRFGSLVPDGDWGPATEAHYQWTRAIQETMNRWKGGDIRADGDYGRATDARVWDLMRRNERGAYLTAARALGFSSALVDGVPGRVFCHMLRIPTHPHL